MPVTATLPGGPPPPGQDHPPCGPCHRWPRPAAPDCANFVYVYEFAAACGVGTVPCGGVDPEINEFVYVYEFAAACGVETVPDGGVDPEINEFVYVYEFAAACGVGPGPDSPAGSPASTGCALHK